MKGASGASVTEQPIVEEDSRGVDHSESSARSESQPLSPSSEQGAQASESQIVMIAWCAIVAISLVVYGVNTAFMTESGPSFAKHSRDAERLGTMVGALIAALGFAWASWRFTQLHRGVVVPNLWGLRLFGVFVFFSCASAFPSPGDRVYGYPPHSLVPTAIAILTMGVMLSPFFVLDRRAKAQTLASEGSS